MERFMPLKTKAGRPSFAFGVGDPTQPKRRCRRDCDKAAALSDDPVVARTSSQYSGNEIRCRGKEPGKPVLRAPVARSGQRSRCRAYRRGWRGDSVGCPDFGERLVRRSSRNDSEAVVAEKPGSRR